MDRTFLEQGKSIQLPRYASWLVSKLLQKYGYWDLYFQKDGAPAHTYKNVQNWQKSKFGQKFVTKKCGHHVHQTSAHVNFTYGGFLRWKIDSPKSNNIADSKVNSEREIRSIKPEVLVSTFQNLEKRLEKVDVNGGHIEHK